MDSNLAVTQLSSALLVVGSMQWLKGAKWCPLVQEGKKFLNRTVSIAAAGAVHLGITFAWSASPTQMGGHNLTVAIPSGAALLIGLFHWGCQFIYQETGYTVLQGITAVQKLLEAANGGSVLAKIAAATPAPKT